MIKTMTRPAAFILLLLGAAGPAGAAALNPADFASLAQMNGSLTDPGGIPTGYFVSEIGPNPTLTDFFGQTVYATGAYSSSGVAVFAFQSININTSFIAGSGITSPGPLPVAFLSESTVNIGAGSNIDVGAIANEGGNGAANLGVGGLGQSIANPMGGRPASLAGGSGGGGFGGMGGDGFAYQNGIKPPFPAGGLGGAPYGDLSVTLQGGSHGGGGSFAGGGGGAVEIGAIGAVTIAGSITANGGNADVGMNPSNTLGDGGGSGGGVFVHGNGVTLASSALLSANGGLGFGGYSFGIAPGGDGGGGSVAIQTLPGGFAGSLRSISVAGGRNAQQGDVFINGVEVINPVPEPSAVVMLATGLAGVLVLARRVRG